ncbi:hypothetical protein GC173_11830 [bacterium]|nr:hypothetical protein [bacterium]
MPQHFSKTMAIAGVAAVGALLLAVLSFFAVTRPLWNDELMAMMNYPLGGLRALFEPLPFYQQAAPPLFNLVCSLLSGLDPVWGRTILLAAITLGVVCEVVRTYRSAAAAAATLLALAIVPSFVPMASELKYYGLEILGMTAAATWLLRKDRDAPVLARDVIFLTCVVLLGISTMVFAPLALAVHIILRWRSSLRLHWREVALLACFLACLAAYYLAVRHATSLQIGTYGQAYDQRGARSAVLLARLMHGNTGRFLDPLLVAAVLATLSDWRGSRSMRLIVYSAIVGLAFSALAFLGLYPASAWRHVVWIDGLFVVYIANAAHLLAARTAFASSGLARAGAAAVACCALLALVSPVRTLTLRHPFTFTDNDKAILDLLDRPERQVGLWIHSQPAIEYYKRLEPALERFEFFGGVNAASAPLPADMAYPNSLSASYAETSSRIERTRNQPGAWGRLTFYSDRRDYSAPAASFVAGAPRQTPFLIFLSFVDLESDDPGMIARVGGLMRALQENGCTSSAVSNGLKYSILLAECGSAK